LAGHLGGVIPAKSCTSSLVRIDFVSAMEFAINRPEG